MVDSGNKRRLTESGTKTSGFNTQAHQDPRMSSSQGSSPLEGTEGAVSSTSAVERPGTPDEDVPTDQERSDETDGGAVENKTRLKHNRVERKYRQRLNNQYERLLGILPLPGDVKAPEMESIPPGDGINAGSASNLVESEHVPGGSKEPEVLSSPNRQRERAVSKAEVLERAKSYIKSLEDEHQRLVAERDELLGIWEASRRKCEEVGPV